MDWSITKRKLCIFIPNFQRGFYILNNLPQYLTKIPKEDWCVVIGNDGYDSCIRSNTQLDENIYSFTVQRSDLKSRNGNCIRNFFIKRCQSEWIIQHDPEILILSRNNFDYIEYIVNQPKTKFLRAGYILMTEAQVSLDILFNRLNSQLLFSPIDPLKHFHIHHFLACPTQVLQEIRGYDEDYTTYGPEDRDMYDRLLKYPLEQDTLESLGSLHLYHPRDINQLNHNLVEMEKIYEFKKDGPIIRNNENWGNLCQI